MIFYATKQTVERYKLPMPEDIHNPVQELTTEKILSNEAGDPMLEWGMKLFYFDRRKCLQLIHFASRMAFFLVDIRIKELHLIGEYLPGYIHDLFYDDKEMGTLIDRWLKEHPIVVYDHLKDRSMIAQLNFTQREFLNDGYTLYEYFKDGILQTRKLNYHYNWSYIPGGKTADGTRDFRYGAERFRDVLKSYYGTPLGEK